MQPGGVILFKFGESRFMCLGSLERAFWGFERKHGNHTRKIRMVTRHCTPGIS